MASRKKNDSAFDRFLGLFGFSRPKKSSSRSKNVSLKSGSKRNKKLPKCGDGPMISDDFQIICDPQPSNKKKKKKKGPIARFFLTTFLIFFITGSILVGALFIHLFNDDNYKISNDLNNLKLAYTSIIYAKDNKGKDVELTRLHGTENRLWVDLEDMPDNLQNAFISAEDKRFIDHTGVDWKRTISAFGNLIFKYYDTEQGGSTITQQLVKNITNDKSTDVSRKVREIMRARYVESKYSKEVIIECYLNTIHLGSGVDGVEVASNYYFDKNVADLTLTQMACLAAVTKSPSGYDPYKYPEKNLSRRNWVLSEMKKNGYISDEELKKAKKADLGLRDEPSTKLSSTKSIKEKYNSYFVDAVIEDVIKGLMAEKNYSYKYAQTQLYKGGYKIYTTMNIDVQNALDSVFADDDNFMKVYTSSGKDPQAAMTIMDYNGNVVGIVGGRGKKKGNRTLNRATQSPRQTGSAMKPIAAYAPAIEYNLITWGSKLEDNPIDTVIDGKKTKWPRNYTGYYSGNVTTAYALQKSINTIPVRLVQEMKPNTVFNFLKDKMGITTLYDEYKVDGKTLSDVNLSSLALGGSVRGITTTELTAAYSVFGAKGMYYQPTTYSKVLDQKNEVILDSSKNEKHKAVSEATANVMNEMLQTVTTQGTGTPAQFGSWPIMSKTGTTSDTKDRWFVGGTPYYVASVWFGMDNNESMSNMSSNPALKLWKEVMVKVHEKLKLKDFKDSDDVDLARYCNSSGKVARYGCYNYSYGYFKKSYEPLCTYHGGEQVPAINKPTAIGSTTSTPSPTSVSSTINTQKTTKKDKTKPTNTTKVEDTIVKPTKPVNTTIIPSSTKGDGIPVDVTTAVDTTSQ